MSRDARRMSGVLLLVFVTIEYGGYFLLGVLRGQYPELALTDFQRSMFRAGHAHAGVWILLSLVCQILVDHAELTRRWAKTVRVGFPVAALLVSGGFFFSAMGPGVIRPNGFIFMVFAGAAVLAVSLVTLGVALIRAK
jgi:hypothetical protein